MEQAISQRNETRRIVNTLLAYSKTPSSDEAERQWDYLSAAHIVGQTDFLQHSTVHIAMLQLALRQREWFEVFGQLFRLSLVPIGHFFKRLPLGNSGRSNVNAFKTMLIEPKIAHLIESAHHSS